MKQRLKHIRLALTLVWSSARGWTVAQTGLALVQGALPVALLFLTKRIVDALGFYLAQPAGAREAGPLLTLAPWAGLVVLAGWMARALSTVVSAAQGEAVTDHVQDTLQRKAVAVDLASYETAGYYDRMRMAQAEAGSRPISIVRNLAQGASSSLALVSVVGVIGVSQGWLLPVLLVAALPGAWTRVRQARLWKRWREANAEPERYAQYLNMLLTALPFAKEIRLNGIGTALRDQHRKLRRRLRRRRLKLLRRRAWMDLGADVLSAAAIAVGLGLIYVRMRSGSMTLGDLALLYGGLQKGRSAFGAALGSLASLYEDALFISHYYDFLALPVEVRSPEHPLPMPRRLEQGIRIEQVVFRYPGTDRDVLRGVDAMIEPGEHVALVGENGCGKTTLVKLLCRFYDPTAGRILIDGTDIRAFALEDLRAAYTGLFQDFVRYYMTAEENIRLGHHTTPPGDARIAEAARKAGAAEIIETLPQGYATRLGRLFTDGAELSEGQWQRIALARSFLKPAPMLLLDEPTSSLDAKAERQLLQTVMGGFADRTAIVVSHRFSTVQAASRVLVLADGRIVESGTHAALLQRQGRYADLFLARTGGTDLTGARL